MTSVATTFHGDHMSLSVLNQMQFRPKGTSGIEVSGGVFFEEYLTNLTGQQFSEAMDKMRRSDPQIRMLLDIIINPIVQANWQVESVDDIEESKMIARFAERVLFDIANPATGKQQTWTSFLKEALSCVLYGYSAFEVVNRVIANDPEFGTYIGLRELGWRNPKTIYQWNLNHDGTIKDIQQQVSGDLQSFVHIPGNDLMVFTVNKEGDNYEGLSPFRAVYASWFRKNIYLKFMSIALERNAVGVPVAQIMQGTTLDTQSREALNLTLQEFRLHERAYMVLPDGVELKEFKLNADIDQFIRAIKEENILMSKAVLANFMELGVNSTGSSEALARVQADTFYGNLTAYGELISETITKRIIEPLVCAKFGKLDAYPYLKVTGIRSKETKENAEILEILTRSGVVPISERLQAQVSNEFRLPALEEQQAQDDQALIEDVELSACCDHGETAFFARSDFENISKKIDRAGAQLLEDMRAALGTSSDDLIDRMLSAYENNSGAKEITEPFKLTMKGRRAFEKAFKAFNLKLGEESVEQVLKELDEKLDKPPANSALQIAAAASLMSKKAFDDLESNIKTSYNNAVGKTDSANDLRNRMSATKDSFLKSASLIAIAYNAASATVNIARDNVYREPKIMQKIESFIFKNDAPVTQICASLAGRVFSKEEYNSTAYLPPLHHNCKSYIVAQKTDWKNNKPLSPAGLTPTGTEAEIAAANKSATFI